MHPRTTKCLAKLTKNVRDTIAQAHVTLSNLDAMERVLQHLDEAPSGMSDSWASWRSRPSFGLRALLTWKRATWTYQVRAVAGGLPREHILPEEAAAHIRELLLASS